MSGMFLLNFDQLMPAYFISAMHCDWLIKGRRSKFCHTVVNKTTMQGRKLNCLGFFVWSCHFVLLCNFSLWGDTKGYDNTITNMSCANQDTILSGPVSEEPSFITNPRTSENRWTELQRNVIFQNIIVKDDLGISKVMKISLPNLNDINFRS